ncbi:MAG: neutral/alkaline non-lysosomal ceramidase N-terminal domain-containing protein [Nannocystaceae bacterium]|nr:neutral/alkaline non-lysosomal ceramidase N-terminal domain-containing protein [Nannocystaceae bacterium]
MHRANTVQRSEAGVLGAFVLTCASVVAASLGIVGCGTATPSVSMEGGSTGAASSATSGAALSSSSSSGQLTTGGSVTTVAVDDTGTAASDSSDGGPSSSTTQGPPVRPRYLLGFDVAAITPSESDLTGSIFMGSYGLPFTRPAEGVHDDLNVRSFAIQLGEDGIILAVTDLPGMGNRFTRDVRARVAAATGLPTWRVLIATTHTHAAPDFQGLWGGGPASYRDSAIDEVVASMNRAWAVRDYGDLAVATTSAPNNNRRDWDITDDELTLLVATDAVGDPLGILTVFAAHPTVLGADNNEISRDWCGYAVDALEAELGVPALLFNGILGDASPAVPPGDYADDFERAQAYGELIAGIAIDAVADVEPVEPAMVADHREWTIVVYNALFDLASTAGIIDYDFEMVNGNKAVETLSTYVRLGHQLQIVSFPGEPVTRNGLDIKDAMVTPHRMVLGQTGDALGYFIPSDEWMTGHNDNYEESISVGSGAGDTARDVLVAMIALDAAAAAR